MSTFYHSSQSGGGPPGPPGAKGDQGDRGPGVLNWRGDWSVTEAYEPNDAVALDGSAYICLEAHTGSQPPSAKWNLLANRGSQGVQGEKGDEGDQGEKGDRGDRGPQGVPGEQGRQGVPGARGYPGEKGDEGDKGDPGIMWRGAWDSLTQYVPGDAVQHDGSCYISVAESIGSEPPSADWGLMVAKGVPGEPGAQGNDGTPGLNWKGEWNDITTYDRNDVVFFNGSSYVAVAENTNDAPPSDNWNMLAQKGSGGGGGGGSINWRGAWSAGAYYEIDDAVSRNGSSYLCIQAHSNHEPPSSTYWGVLAQKGDTGAQGLPGLKGDKGDTGEQGLPGDKGDKGDTGEQGLPGLKGDKGDTGEQGAVGINWRGTWSSSTPYALRDGVTLDGTSYVCTQANTNQQPPNASYWDVLAAKGDPGGAGAGPVSLTNADSVALNGCQVVFSFGSGSCKRAKADALGTATVIGLAAVGDNPPGSLMGVVVDGPVTASTSAWDAVTGLSGGLTAGAVYYLSSVTTGWLTTSVPSTLGQFIVRIGVALSSTTMLIQIQPPIQL